MNCIFCTKKMARVAHPGSDKFKIIVCRACRLPGHYTVHRELWCANSNVKLYDQIQVDDYIITRYFKETVPGGPKNFSNLYRETYGIIDNVVGGTPIGKFPPICTLDHIVDLPVHDLDLFKKKIRLWTTFS